MVSRCDALSASHRRRQLRGCQRLNHRGAQCVVGVGARCHGRAIHSEQAVTHAHGEQLFAWMADGKLAPHVDAVLPFERAAEALTRMEQRAVKGKVVLVP